MAVIIGSTTTASIGGGCVFSVSWSMSQNSQNLYCLGSWDPFMTVEKPTQTINASVYAPGPSYDTAPTQGCANANTLGASVSPGSCGGSGGGGVSGNFFVTSYSYSKDDGQMPGQESWSMMQYVGDNQPTYVMRGISEGQSSTGSDTGISFSRVTGTGSTGSVSAGSFGRADTMQTGVVGSVGGGTSDKGATGNGSASIPYTPLYI